MRRFEELLAVFATAFILTSLTDDASAQAPRDPPRVRFLASEGVSNCERKDWKRDGQPNNDARSLVSSNVERNDCFDKTAQVSASRKSYQDYPVLIRRQIEQVVYSCKEAGFENIDPDRAIEPVSLDSPDSDDGIIVDVHRVCETTSSGIACSNYSCRLEIFKNQKGVWRKVLELDWIGDAYDYCLNTECRERHITGLVSYSDPNCRGKHKDDVCSFRIVRKGGRWLWQRLS